MPASEQYWRSLPQMHKVFAGSAIVLLGATLLMMYQDGNKSWIAYQKEAEVLRLERIAEQAKEFNDVEYLKQKEELQGQVDSQKEALSANKDEISDLQAKLKKADGRVQNLKAASKEKNAQRDKIRADYDILVRDESPADELAAGLAKFEEAVRVANETALQYEQAVAEYDALKSEIDNKRSKLVEAETALSELKAAEDLLDEQKNQIEPESTLVSLKRWIKQWPIIEGFDPIYKIQYDWAPDLEQHLGMVSVDRVDRCRTCHVNIDDFSVIRKNGAVVGMTETYSPEDYEQPFCSHPRADVYLTASSPHPVNKFACTICHGGDGSGTSFQNAEHTPSNPVIADNWHEEHSWHSNHFWEDPQKPSQFIESSCLKCHHNVVELGVNEKYGATAPKVFKGYETIRDYGCFGCHEINGYDGATPIGPDLRLEPNTPEELAAIEADPNMMPGKMRKVGPSLRHIAHKTTPEFVAYWTEKPSRFRPTTRMPQFFNLTNQHDAMGQLLQPIELAGIAKYLESKSESFEYLAPQEGYAPDVARGEDLFAKRGCLACHSKAGEAFAGINANFGPDLSRIHEKIKPGADGFAWMYTWIKEPSKYHTRTRMPDLYLDPYNDELSGTYIDPAADIAAYLLQGGTTDFPALATPKPNLGLVAHHDFTAEDAEELGLSEEDFRGVLIDEVIQGSPANRAEMHPGDIVVSFNGTAVRSPEQLADLEAATAQGDEVTMGVLRNGREIETKLTVSTPLDDLVRLYVGKALGSAGLEKTLENRGYPVTADMYEDGQIKAELIKGDEIELVPTSADEDVSAEVWEERKLTYIGRRTISRYGCYGCHDIPGFETARPIGTALQDWGVKDTSKLAYEHIHEYLHHHGELPDDADADHAEDEHGHAHDEHGHGGEHAALGTSTAARMEKVIADYGDESVSEADLTEAMLYKSVISHGRAGFIWQKLRQPRSYDYKKIETKNWDERLVMPRFPFDQEQVESVATFVLGLVAAPPAPEYQYYPGKEKEAIFTGEKLLAKYNCTGCHVLDMDSIEFEYDPEILAIKGQEINEADQKAFDLLSHIKPIGRGGQGATGEVTEDGSVVYRARGFIQGVPDPEEEDPEFRFYSYRFWDGFQLDDGKYIMPSEAVQIAEGQVRGFIDGRGGDFGEWLAGRLAPELSKTPGGTDFNAAWQASVPTLDREGHKVQTPWLYQFLKNPNPLRRTTVLRMPKFNMDDAEALALANYFAAKDGVPFPYQTIEPKLQAYQAEQAALYAAHYPEAEDKDYLTASWNVLNGPLCRKCHNVGGNVVNDPKQVKGPNLQRIEKRLRPEWTQLWVYKPMWVYPYTAMPENFPPDKPADMKALFGGENPRQAQSVIEALFNYTELIDVHGTTTYNPETPAAPEAAAAGGAE